MEYTFERKVKYRIDCKTLLEARRTLQCRRLITTQMSEDMLARLSLEIESAEDGQRVAL